MCNHLGAPKAILCACKEAIHNSCSWCKIHNSSQSSTVAMFEVKTFHPLQKTMTGKFCCMGNLKPTFIGKGKLTGKNVCHLKTYCSQSLVIVPCCWLSQMRVDVTASSTFPSRFCFVLFFLLAIGRTLHAMIIFTIVQALGFILIMAGMYLTANGKSHLFLESWFRFLLDRDLTFLFLYS